MQHRKFLIPILAVLLVGVAVPLSTPRAHGDDTSETLNITGLVARGTYDSYLGSTVDAIQAGNTLTFHVIFTQHSFPLARRLFACPVRQLQRQASSECDHHFPQ